ncbi:unnamed protein product [Victoria cruziana]
MDLSDIAARLGISDSKPLIRKAEELRRLFNAKFDSSIIGVGEVCKAVICLEIAASRLKVMFDRPNAVRLSGMSDKAYIRSFNAMQNCLGVKAQLDVRELGIQFGCVRLIPFVQRGLALYKYRFRAALPENRRGAVDFSRAVFTGAAFYLCAKRHKLKVDKLKMIELCGTSESEFSNISTSMNDLCFDVFGTAKEKKDPTVVKGHRELLDALPGKRKHEDGGDTSDESFGSTGEEDASELPTYKRHKRMEKRAYDEWKSSVLASNSRSKLAEPNKKQAQLNFARKVQKPVTAESL